MLQHRARPTYHSSNNHNREVCNHSIPIQQTNIHALPADSATNQLQFTGFTKYKPTRTAKTYITYLSATTRGSTDYMLYNLWYVSGIANFSSLDLSNKTTYCICKQDYQLFQQENSILYKGAGSHDRACASSQKFGELTYISDWRIMAPSTPNKQSIRLLVL